MMTVIMLSAWEIKTCWIFLPVPNYTCSWSSFNCVTWITHLCWHVETQILQGPLNSETSVNIIKFHHRKRNERGGLLCKPSKTEAWLISLHFLWTFPNPSCNLNQWGIYQHMMLCFIKRFCLLIRTFREVYKNADKLNIPNNDWT